MFLLCSSVLKFTTQRFTIFQETGDSQTVVKMYFLLLSADSRDQPSCILNKIDQCKPVIPKITIVVYFIFYFYELFEATFCRVALCIYITESNSPVVAFGIRSLFNYPNFVFVYQFNFCFVSIYLMFASLFCYDAQ